MTVATTESGAPARKRPATARAPQDHKKATSKANQPKVTPLPDGGFVVVHKGVSIEITAEALNDYELLEDITSGDETRIPAVLRRLCGDDHQAVKESCRDPQTGRVLLVGEGSITEWIAAVLGAINPS